jgi:hypothetical protein
MTIDISRYIIKRPTSSYAVIGRLMKLVAEEPKRMHMGTTFDDDFSPAVWSNAPQCGTVGCIAGWSRYITGATEFWSQMERVLVGDKYTCSAALEFNQGFTGGDHFVTPDGTQEQADAVVDFLKAFRKKHKALLQARIIHPGGRVKGE